VYIVCVIPRLCAVGCLSLFRVSTNPAVNTVAAKMFQLEKRRVYTTPKSFLGCLSLYKHMLDQQRETTSADIKRLSSGLKKLKETVSWATHTHSHILRAPPVTVCSSVITPAQFAPNLLLLLLSVLLLLLHLVLMVVMVRSRVQGDDVAFIEKSLKVLLVEAEEKACVAQTIAEQVTEDKKRVELEKEAAATETRICEEIKVRTVAMRSCRCCCDAVVAARCGIAHNTGVRVVAAPQLDVLMRQRETEADLARAEPAVHAAMAALDTLNKKDLVRRALSPFPCETNRFYVSVGMTLVLPPLCVVRASARRWPRRLLASVTSSLRWRCCSRASSRRWSCRRTAR
jgi:hypothetical protein